MKTRLFCQTILSIPLLMGISSTALANHSDIDPYIAGFANYAKEIESLGDSKVSGQAVNSYALEVTQMEQKVGYIGKELPIPKATKVMEGVYTVVGSFIWGTPTNFGLNNNLSAIIFKDGVFVYNSGSNTAVAYSFHQQIKRLTDKPVKWLAVENDQRHAYFGSSYWYDVGVKNLYSEKRVNDNWHRIFTKSKQTSNTGVGKVLTLPVRDVTDKFSTFEGSKTIDVGGGETVQLINFGGGHTPSMTGMYIPSRNLLFTGDLGFNERLPGLLHDSQFKAWIASFEKMVSMVPKDVVVIPGHGTPTDLATLKRQTYDYFVDLGKAVETIVENGGSIEEVDAIDQSKHKNRPVFNQLSKANARHIYNELMAEKENNHNGNNGDK